MGLKEFFLWQLEHEAATARKVIERVPEGRSTWKPNDRSMDLGHLATLVASMPGWVEIVINRRELNLCESEGKALNRIPANTRAELLTILGEGLARSRKALEGTTEDHLTKMWRFRRNNEVIHEGPRYAMISDAAMTNLAHHRGELTVYLRLLGQRVPNLYEDTQHP